MQFRTQIPIPKSNHPIDYDSRIVSLGSCFAVNISQKLEYYKFRGRVNPFGILFHPLAIEKLIGFAVAGKEFGDDDVFFHNDCWHCFDAHSDLNSIDKAGILQKLNNGARDLRQQLAKSTHVIITLGTAWVYRNEASLKTVANCHKVPQRQFTKELLSTEDIQASIEKSISQIRSLNREAKIILTISPVRHLKDGFAENQNSKANLISALHKAMAGYSFGVAYFPGYEIMMDELRDYRFYAEDMVHPTQIAIDYIWKRFSETNIAASSLPFMDTIASIQKGLAHRPFNADTAQHQEFVKQLQASIFELKALFPHIDF